MGSRVLLADDSVTIQKVVGIIFANEDYELTVVDSGDAALQKAREIKPDIMLVDALMPGKNGYEVCSEIRRDPQLSHIALLLMIGAFEAIDEEKARQSGADDTITKPFESQTLIDMTSKLIALTRQRASRVPDQAPAAPQQPAAVSAPAAPAAVASPQPLDSGWDAGFDTGFAAEVSPVQPPAFSAPAPAESQPVAATADDDLWGVFDMDAIEAPATAAPVQSNAAPDAPAGDDNFFSFDAKPPLVAAVPIEDEFVLEDEVFAEPETATSGTASGFEPFGEEEFSFGTEELPPVPVVPLEEDFSTISFDEPAPAAPVIPAVQPVPPPASPVEPPVMAQPAPEPAPAVIAPPEPVVAVPAAPPGATAPVAAPAALEEEQLKMLLSKVSRDVIEKIVWEVVPDLAESIIREEIRKIKEGIGR